MLKTVPKKACVRGSSRLLLPASLVPCLLTIPWAKANLNYTGQALIISGASIASYFVTADKTILKAAKKNARYERKD
ncbi:early nodulin-93-like isoform X2 [Rhododendron vialii]|uniref:early nodulin-93-like isoform X2 n=1 Tax=Rhododendron vialii TaxID=182163 RepID=UPI0026603602|nr:early nodulin-93-like isoform X2 [Rhododendron vialii]